VIAPKWWRVASALRGILNPLLDRRMARDPELHAMLREAERGDRPTGTPPTG
jgi:hypothetical protein